jgi:transcriptional regulator with XRE-family HTH domain
VIYVTLPEKIRLLRKQRNMTYEEIGNIVGVGKSTVRKWENGLIKNMRRDKIKALAYALGTTPGYLMGWDETETPVASSSKGDADLSSHEHTVITAYREQPEMQPAVCRILNVSDQPAPQEQPPVASEPTAPYSPQILEMSKKYGVDPEYMQKVVEESSTAALSVADGTADTPGQMRYMHLTARECEMVCLYRFDEEKREKINSILDEPVLPQKKMPKPSKGSGKE